MTERTPPIVIFCETPSERLTYVLDFIFSTKGRSYRLVSESDKFSGAVALSYSSQNVDADLNYNPSGLLAENNISNQWQITFDPEVSSWAINGQTDDLSIIFYYLSRYEEYTDQNRDQYGRYRASQSSLFKTNQLHLPWCDILVKNIWTQIGLNPEELTDQFKTILTYDIDIAWAYQHKPKWRSAVNWVIALSRPGQFMERWQVATGKKKDPYDTYYLIEKNALTHTSHLFFLLGNYGHLDKNHHWKNKKLQELIRGFKDKAKMGIHPSFNSFLKELTVEEERDRLANITHLKIKTSRQHYLRFTLPESYKILQNIGITHDYSMGYADHYGFRAGTSFPFFFFDLALNQQTNLTIVPFSVMDGTLKEYMNISPREAIRVIANLKSVIQSVGGQFVPIWHNHSIGDQKEWEGWQIVYDECVK